MRPLALLLGLVLWVAAYAGAPDQVSSKEIAYLIEHLASSGCQFNRNGAWYDSARAVSHLKRKYDYLLKKGLVTDTDAFIKLAATESSVSGKPYLVKCGTQPEKTSADWFREALARFRADGRVGSQ